MIDDKVMDSLLELSRLSLEPDELSALKGQLADIISYFEVLESHDTEGVDVDMGRAVQTSGLRADASARGIERGQIDDFAVSFEDGLFVVPRILGDEHNA